MIGLRAGILTMAAGTATLSGQSVPSDWVIDTARSRVVVHVLPAGLLSSALHPHHFEPQSWEGEISREPDRPAAVRIAVRFAADSLRDRQPKLSAKDIAKVEAQARGPEILDAARFPKILFEAGEVEPASGMPEGAGEFRVTLAGKLSLHGQTRPVRLAVQARVTAAELQATATAAFKQSDFGIKPYSTALGTIAVRDEVTVEITLVASPRNRSVPEKSARTGREPRASE